MPLSLRVDPWTPDYESAIRFEGEPADDPPVDTSVETDEWRLIRPSESIGFPATIFFIDGVRRIDVGVIREEDLNLVFGLLGSYAAGVSEYRSGNGTIGETRIRRRIVLGAGIRHDPIDVEAGSAVLRYEGHGTPENDRQHVVNAIQVLMRTLEGELAKSLTSHDALTFVDGPLTYLLPLEEPIVGYVKTHTRHYLSAEHMRTVTALEPGTRSPVFAFGEASASRYSWYMRLAQPRTIDHSLAGIVRLEVSHSVGADDAVRLADTSSAALPRFASRSAWDPRAPQNLYPISALEERLRHLLGDRAWIRRHIEAHIHREGVAA
jgi:hypothetical protein